MRADSAPNKSSKQSIIIPLGNISLGGDLCVPPAATGLIIFAHGSGSSRFSPRNRYVAEFLNREKQATLLFDLLTTQEEEVDIFTRRLRFDIELLAMRMRLTTEWLKEFSSTRALNIGYFGASTGAAAALIAAAELPTIVKAIVSRGGRPDLAGSALRQVKAPTLLIVGSNDPEVLELNNEAAKSMTTEKKVVVIAGATHLFEESGTLEKAATIASDWFKQYLSRQGA
jgi:putative phosphoribosyl transferase